MATIKIEDLVFDKEQLSCVINALDDMELLRVEDVSHESAGRISCLIVPAAHLVNVERDDDDEITKIEITRPGIGHRESEVETLLDIPDELSSIPGVDSERLVWHFFESDDLWNLNVTVSYSVKEALYEYSEISGPYYESASAEDLKIEKIMLIAEHDDYDITEFVDDDVKRILRGYCDDYIAENVDESEL